MNVVVVCKEITKKNFLTEGIVYVGYFNGNFGVESKEAKLSILF